MSKNFEMIVSDTFRRDWTVKDDSGVHVSDTLRPFIIPKTETAERFIIAERYEHLTRELFGPLYVGGCGMVMKSDRTWVPAFRFQTLPNATAVIEDLEELLAEWIKSRKCRFCEGDERAYACDCV